MLRAQTAIFSMVMYLQLLRLLYDAVTVMMLHITDEVKVLFEVITNLPHGDKLFLLPSPCIKLRE